ncbi:MAG: MFS transporter [Paenibacillus macerans]|uniref:Major Facilitator Superfamily protein n=1 Tax=Paenibacillus macerans TaxID=44252 RepID=A0A090ZJF3_PAEMA|nr:MFS transporter [Paenibacillus macerans]KFN11469.1 major Facilitator Superfamily protein [Paenibacillus macerans]MBS5911515.1 MFS transporter [Paenibacillus macerans]MCY7561285.1 MFS transporter [Paenibacillus macerans]MDU7473462.1 MFS transporter [Paenibacillus macerans]MEC0136395.1 MFS transporter [Paenibacillus macerans]
MKRSNARASGPELRIVAYSSGNLAVNLLSQAFAAYLVYYYVDVLGARPAWISLAMVAHGALNAVLNPLLGHMSDRTRTRFGRRIPYIAFGLLPLAAVFAALWIPPAAGDAVLPYFVATVFLYDALFVTVVLNYSALFPEMFPTMEERAYVSSWRQMLGIVGMIIGVALPPLVYSQIGFGAMGAVFAAVAAAFLAMSLWGSRETNPGSLQASFRLPAAIRHTLTNRAFMLYVLGSFLVQFTFALLPAGIPFFTKYVLEREESFNTVLLGAIFLTAVPSVFAWGRITAKSGPRRGIMAAAGCYLIALLPFSLVTGNVSVIVAAAVGFGLAGLLVLLDVMLSEVIDEDERRTGARREGMYFGMNGFIVRWGVSLQAGCLGLILEMSGYAAHQATQPGSVISGIRWMMSGIPAASMLLALCLFYFYPIGKSRTKRR